MTRPAYIALFATLPLPASAGMQSVLTAAGRDAQKIAELTWVLSLGGLAILLLVLVMLALALRGAPLLRKLLARRSLIISAGIIFPTVVLSVLLIHALRAAPLLTHDDTQPALRIEVLGEMWWWRVRYLDQDGGLAFETANDIRIPVGVPVEFVLKSKNVIHSFWVPNLAGKLDMIPGRVNRLRVLAQEPGIFRGQCAEYCGAQHAKMMLHVHALSRSGFDQWAAAQRLPAKAPANAMLMQGKQIVMAACAHCHTIRGTSASGTLGPDLTHVGSRLSLAAGVLPNNAGTLAGWIAASQHIKPDNLMPDFNDFSGAQLRSVAQYMESLQ